MKLYVFSLVIFNVIIYTVCQLQSTFIKPLANDTCGISTGGPLVQQLTTTVSYAGGLFWSDNGVKIAYVDRYGPAFGRYTPNDGRFNRLQINEGRESIVVFPVRNETGTGLKFVIGLDHRLIMSVVTGSGTNLVSTLYNLLNVTNKREKFMRGKCDNYGRLWYASSGENFIPAGHLYKIENLGEPQIMETNLFCGAGMAWTQDYQYFYLVDSAVGIIYKYDFNAESGTIDNKRIIFRLSQQTNLRGTPFDIAVDTAGYLWIGMLEGGSVIQYDETTATVLWTIAVPAKDIVSLEFGGLDKKTLYVGTKQSEDVGSGAIFAISGLGATGFTNNDIVIPYKWSSL